MSQVISKGGLRSASIQDSDFPYLAQKNRHPKFIRVAILFVLLRTRRKMLSFYDDDLVDLVTLNNIVDDVDTFNHFAKASVVAVQVRGIVAAVADKKL